MSVTKKGQATIPKTMREHHKIGKKALVLDTEEGVLFMPIPDPSQERGSLAALFGGKSSKEIMDELRSEELKRERNLLKKKGV